MSNKYQRLNTTETRTNLADSTSTGSDMIFGSLETSNSLQHLDLVAALRACNSFVDVIDDRSLDGLLKSRVGGKMFTLYNMANSGFYIRKSKSLLTESSRSLTGSKELYELDKSTKYSEMIPLHEFWQIYASAFIDMLDAVSLSDIEKPYSDLRLVKHDMLISSFELVGSVLEVADSSNKEWIGTRGIVVDERENVFKLLCESNKQKLIPKSACTFRVETSGRRALVLFGPDLAGVGRSGSLYRTQPCILQQRHTHPLKYV